MILLGSEFTAGPLTLLRDHVAPALFHCLPAVPRLRRLELLRHRGAAAGGGSLTLEVDVAHDAAALDAARAALAARGMADATLVPVLYEAGSVRLAALGQADGAADSTAGSLVERILGTATPSLFGHARASFAVTLDAEGATLAAAAIAGGAAPIVVTYDLQLRGLRPARGLQVRLRYHMADSYLRTRMEANAVVFQSDIDAEAEALARRGDIAIQDVDYTGADPAVLAQRNAAALDTLRELTRETFFRPAASPAALEPQALERMPGGAAAWTRQGRPQAAFLLRALRQEEDAELTYDYREAQPVTLRIAPQAALRPPPGLRPEDCLRDVTLEAPQAGRVIHLHSPADADWRGVAAIEVTLTGGGETRGAVLRPQAAAQQVLLPSGPATYHATVLATPAPGEPGLPLVGTTRPLDTDDLLLDPGALAGRRVLRCVLGVVDPAMVQAAQGRLVAADGAAVDILLDAARPEQELVVWGGMPLRLEAALIGPAGRLALPPRDIAAGETVVALNQPADRFVTLLVVLQDPLDRLAAAQLELVTPGGQHGSLALDSATPAARWSMRREGAEAGRFRYRLRLVRRDSRVVEAPWRDAAGSLLVVGDPEVRVDTIEVVLAGIADAEGVLLTLTSLDPPPETPASVDIVLDAGQASCRMRLPFRRDAPRRYRVEGLVLRAAGEQPIPPREDTAETLLLLLAEPPPAVRTSPG